MATWLSTGDEVAGWIVEVEEDERVDDEVDDAVGIITIDGIVAEGSTVVVSVSIDVEVPEVTKTTMVVVGRFVGSIAVPDTVVLGSVVLDGAADGDAVPPNNDIPGC
jgi:hypothetical protein